MCLRGAGHLPDCFFVRRQPDKVVKVDVLCGLGGDGMHAEELPFSLTMGWGGREGGEEEKEKDGDKKQKKREGTRKLADYNNQIKAGGGRDERNVRNRLNKN